MAAPFKLRVDDNFPGLVNEAPMAAHPDRREPVGKHSGIFKLRIDGVFAIRTDVAEATAAADGDGSGSGIVGNKGAGAAAELDRRQPFAENIGLVELRIDLHLP